MITTLHWHGTMWNSDREKICFPCFVNPLVPKQTKANLLQSKQQINPKLGIGIKEKG
jgi:hypothetical protein